MNLAITLLIFLFSTTTTCYCHHQAYEPSSFARRLHHLAEVHQAIHAVLESKESPGHSPLHPNATIVERIMSAEAVASLLRRVKATGRLEACYNCLLGGHRLSVFETPVKTVLLEYLKAHFHHQHHYWGRHLLRPEELREELGRLKANLRHLLENILEMVRLVVDCLTDERPDFQPTQMGLTEFTIWPKEQFSKLYLKPMGRKRGAPLGDYLITDHQGLTYDESTFGSLPSHYDYRQQGVISETKNQAYCGTCFLFGPMAAMESSYMLKHNKRGVSFSEMNLFNCMHKDGVYTDKSCHNGGDVAAVYQAARDHGLVLTKDDEPYMSKISRTDSNFTFVFKPKHCDIKPVVTRLQNWGSISEVNGPQRENILKSLLLKYGPLTTYFRADKAFMALTGEWNRPCNQSVAINHVMTVIGWTKKHWIMKNSYGNYPKIVLPKNEWGEEEGEAPQTWFLPFGVNGYLYSSKRHAEGCGIFGENSSWDFPEME